MEDKCFYCGDTGHIHTEDDIPDQMCPNCEIGQAVIKGYNHARDIGIQACETLEAAKDERIKELEIKIQRQEKNIDARLERLMRTIKDKQAGRIKELEVEKENLKSLLEQLIFIAEKSTTDDSEDTTIELAVQALKGK